MSILIIDYGMGNLASVAHAIERLGERVVISGSPSDLKKCKHIILPGVGAFPDAMQALREQGWEAELRQAVLEQKQPFLGICLGMQLLADQGEEHETTAGLGFISGAVKPLPANMERLPHIGWNEVHQTSSSQLFENIEPSRDFYFVHSFHFLPTNPNVIAGTTEYCGGFVSVIEHENIFAVQFHPEKSSKNGMKLLSNFIKFQ
ncbi:imidazole glycerol phosphate synthase subunit HisH [Chitinibacter sp. S2-10]|uniref:imidazole glycerol phosphate synthase subunit HisH n=1 Tax=Chitinibacter sp. S2-10 TaxID=3373597 RepID=UPI003977AEFA